MHGQDYRNDKSDVKNRNMGSLKQACTITARAQTSKSLKQLCFFLRNKEHCAYSQNQVIVLAENSVCCGVIKYARYISDLVKLGRKLMHLYHGGCGRTKEAHGAETEWNLCLI